MNSDDKKGGCVWCLPLPDSPVLTSRVAVTIQVLDINEFPPELASPHETFVCENAKAGQVRPHTPRRAVSCCAGTVTTFVQAGRQAAVNWRLVYPPGRPAVNSRCTFGKRSASVEGRPRQSLRV